MDTISINELPATAKVARFYDRYDERELFVRLTSLVADQPAARGFSYGDYNEVLTALNLYSANAARTLGQALMALDVAWGHVRMADGTYVSATRHGQVSESERRESEVIRNAEYAAAGGTLDEKGRAPESERLTPVELMEMLADDIDERIAKSDAAERIARRRADRAAFLA
jgi:hypothetical protein